MFVFHFWDPQKFKIHKEIDKIRKSIYITLKLILIRYKESIFEKKMDAPGGQPCGGREYTV